MGIDGILEIKMKEEKIKRSSGRKDFLTENLTFTTPASYVNNREVQIK